MTSPHPSFILDISRLLSRAEQRIPTGIDRVELAYAEHLLTYHKEQTYFVALAPTGWIGLLPRDIILTFIKTLAAKWNLGEKQKASVFNKIKTILKAHLLIPRAVPQINGPVFYLLLSHHHLTKMHAIKKFISTTKSYFVPMIHDLIPIEYPEYARPREKTRHEMRINTVIHLADAIITPTQSVSKSLKPFLEKRERHNTPIWSIPHGIYSNLTKYSSENKELLKKEQPYFVYLSTIEPRKNHFLLLHLWRRMVQKRGENAVPKLVLIGKRGWENENILDLLERSPALQNVVTEHNNLPDKKVASLLRNSNGLLFPSFTEGYGLPLIEAMSLSVPSVCSDIPALREVGGDIPLYADPLNTQSWENAIDDFSKHGPLWHDQKERLKKWSPYSWKQSVSNTLDHCKTLAKQ